LIFFKYLAYMWIIL